ncbi:MAG: 4-alpha-glucanotransferase, partial [Chitinophagaceae bacterium]
MKIHFFLRFHTKPGQRLSISGNIVELGAGRPENAISLEYANSEYWHLIVDVNPVDSPRVNYHYILTNEDGFQVMEASDEKGVDISKAGIEEVELHDTWNHAGEFENVFYANPFQNVLLRKSGNPLKEKGIKNFTHIFKVKAPLLGKNEIPCIVGSDESMAHWNTSAPVLLNPGNRWWSIKLNLPQEAFYVTYKYGVYNTKDKSFVRFEEGTGRTLLGDGNPGKLTVCHDGFIHLPNNSWKAAGVSIPVFSLRSKDSFGVGEFNDLKLLADWARKTNLKVIQILPVNDTTATHSWLDTYPYAAISAFALHPMYLNLADVAGKEHATLLDALKKKQKQLNELLAVDYDEVGKIKTAMLKVLYEARKHELKTDNEYNKFFETNKHWLVPYAAFCYLRDRNETSDFNKWKLYSKYDKDAIEKYVSPKSKHYDKIAVNYFIQYHLHLQLKAAAEYAHRAGVILKGDIAIGVYRYGCDAWMEPGQYHIDMQAGAPPDLFAIKGQNWGFPTYNWEVMAASNFDWWHKRFQQMGEYFDAFRIDHILGFFRIWSIPMYSVEGIMGKFVPAIPVYKFEFGEKNIWFDFDRYIKPYITDTVLWDMFGPNREKFKPFLHANHDGTYDLREGFKTQRQVETHFAGPEITNENLHIRQGLYDLISNIILFEEPGSHGEQFHFRFNMETTHSFRHLEWNTQQQLKSLYINYFFGRQDNFWMKEAMKKLPALKRATNMLICGEDLGLVPHSVPDVMKQLGILSLEIQRMPKDINTEFFHPANAPYLSVVTPSTHDMSTVRGWWEEDRAKTQRFYNYQLGQWGDAPYFCEPWINKDILLQHLYSPAMLAIFQLQDILGISATLRREDPHAERINIPAVSRHYWNYRMHISLEQLLKETDFNEE